MKTNLLNVVLNDKTLLTNGAVFTITLTNVEMVLKIILLVGSITWTGIKIYQELKKKKDE